MAYTGSGFGPTGSVFGGFAGGYTQTPEGIILPSTINSTGFDYASVLNTNLPNVDPNNYPGAIHVGPSSTFIGSGTAQLPFNAGYVDSNLGMYGAANFNGGF